MKTLLTGIFALIRYFFLFESTNSHTTSSKVADIKLKHSVLEWQSFLFLIENNLSNNLISSLRLAKVDVMMVRQLSIIKPLRKNVNSKKDNYLKEIEKEKF